MTGVFADIVSYLQRCESICVVAANDVCEHLGPDVPDEQRQRMYKRVLALGVKEAIRNLNEALNEEKP